MSKTTSSLFTTADKHYFGAYLNLARHSVFLIFAEIAQKVEAALPDEEGLYETEILKSLINNNTRLETRTLILRQLRKHFPFLYLFIPNDANIAHNDFEIAHLLLSTMLKRLNEERNLYSHYKEQTIDFITIQANESDTYSEALNLIREGFTASLDEELDPNYRRSRRYPNVVEKDLAKLKKRLWSNNESLWQGNQGAFSEKGLIFFTSLFLERKQANLFVSRLKATHQMDNKLDYLIRASYLHFCLSLPQPRLDSSDIALDMLNELNRCPKKLYQLLSDQDKQHFNDPINYNGERAVRILDNNNELKSIQERIRYENRFPYFALRYFDDQKVFKQLRFQLYVGRLVSDYYQKPLQGRKEDRYILQDIYTFQRFEEINKQDIEDKGWVLHQHLPQEADSKLDTKPSIGEIVQYAPHYHFSGTKEGRIAIALSPDAYPEKRPITHKSGRTTYKLSSPKSAEAYLSVSELPNLFLATYLNPTFNLTNFTKDTLHDIFIEEALKPLITDRRDTGKIVKAIKGIQHEQTLYQLKTVMENGASFADIETFVETQNAFLTRNTPTEAVIERFIQTFRAFFNDLNQGKWQPIAKADLMKKKVRKKDSKKSFMPKANNPYKEDEIQKVEARKKLLQERLDAHYGGILKYWHLPDDVLGYLLGFYALDYKKEALNKLKEMREDTQKRLKKLQKIVEKQEELEDEKSKLKQGKIASWLADDIVFFKPLADPKNKNNPKQGKPNNDQYRRLQQLLALYGGHQNQIYGFLIELGLIGQSQSKHPFLEKLFQNGQIVSRTLFDFYKLYLQARAKYLGYHNKSEKVAGIYEAIEGKYEPKTKKFVGGLAAEQIQQQFGHLFAFGLPPKNALQKNYDQIPIMLPKGLFNDLIQEAIRKADDSPITEQNQPIFALEQHLQVGTQPFYDYQRHYLFPNNAVLNNKKELEQQLVEKESRVKLMETLKTQVQSLALQLDKTPPKKRQNQTFEAQQNEFFALKEFRKQVMDTEKEIRYLQFQDRCLWLMVKKMKQSNTQKEASIDFESATLQEVDTFLNGYLEMQVKVAGEKQETAGVVAQIFYRDEQGNIQYTKDPNGKLIPQVIGEPEGYALSYKQYGDLRKFAKDRRLADFFAYFNLTEIKYLSKTQLERALDYLDTHKHQVVQGAMEIEKSIHQKWGVLDANFPQTEFAQYLTSQSNGNFNPNDYIKYNEGYLSFLYHKIPTLTQQIKQKELAQLRNKMAHNQIPINAFLKAKLLPYHIPSYEVDFGKKFMEAMFNEIRIIYQKIQQEILNTP